jgi:hypothetical protein
MNDSLSTSMISANAQLRIYINSQATDYQQTTWVLFALDI